MDPKEIGCNCVIWTEMSLEYHPTVDICNHGNEYLGSSMAGYIRIIQTNQKNKY